MVKRFFSILFVLFMMVSMMMPTSAAYLGEKVTLEITTDKNEVFDGEEFTLTVTMKQSVSKLGVLYGTFDYDEDILTYVSSEVGTTIGGTIDHLEEYGNKFVMYTWDTAGSGDDYDANTVVCNITFKVNSSIGSVANVAPEFIVEEGNFSDATMDQNDIPYTITNATVKVVPKPVPVESVTIDETLSIKTGESKTPGYTVNPAEATNKAVSFKSDNTAVATVNETTGEVAGVKEGTATITITTADGKFTDACVVTVECSHANKTATEEKASDCKTQGWDAYSTCDACGQLFNEAGEEIDKIPLRDLSTDHKYDNACDAECNVCNAARDVEDHKYDNAEDMICNECGYDRSCKHTDLTIVPEKESDCKTQGWDAYRECSCGKIFDMNDKELEKIPYRDLDMTKHTGGTATCKTLAVCSVCEKEYGELNADNHEGTADWVETDVPELMHRKEYDCCGAVVVSGDHVFDDVNDMICNECGYDRTCSHTGGTATCTEQAVCEKCSKPYGALAAHDFTKEDTKDDALKTKGDCGKEAVYFKSCTACGAVDDDENNTFRGEKDAANHADYGTYIDGYSAPDHKNQIDGHTGVEKCKECDYIFNQGEIIPAGEHVPSEEWQSDENDHWKVCSVEDCEFMFKETLDVHSTEKEENKATCQKLAVCDTCGKSYGELELHEFTEEIKDEAHLNKENLPENCEDNYIYFYDCANCDEIATSENFTFSGDVLGHDYSEEIKDERHLRKEATNCLEKTSYWYNCSRCEANAGADETATDKWYETDETGDHQYNEEEWGYKAEDGHAHKCILCGAPDDVIEHTPNIEEATEEEDKVCTECGYVIDTKKHVHTSTVVPGYAATCTSTGLTEGSKCTECGTVFVEQQIIPKLAHEAGMTVVERVILATPYHPGSYDFVRYCVHCGTELSRQTMLVPYSRPVEPEVPVVPETPVEPEAPHIHNYEDIDGYDPTCTETGLTDGVVCKDCGEFLLRSEIIPATGHTYGAFVVENLVEATAAKDGSYDLVSDCTVCGEELARVTIVLPATGGVENPDTADEETSVNAFVLSSVIVAVISLTALATKKFLKIK